MKQRNPIAVFLLTCITFGIYGIVWSVKTKEEMKKLGADIPTAWLLLVPIVNLYWSWKYCEGVEKVTGGKLSGVLAFVILILLGPIGMAIIQNEFNKLGDNTALAAATTDPANVDPAQAFIPPAAASVAPAQPQADNNFGSGSASVESTPSTFTPPAAPIPTPTVTPQAGTDVMQPVSSAPSATPISDVAIPEPAFVAPTPAAAPMLDTAPPAEVATTPSSSPQPPAPSQPPKPTVTS